MSLMKHERSAPGEAVRLRPKDEPLPIVKACMLLLEACPACRGSPKITCNRCRKDLLVLGQAVFRLLSSPG
ncbi:MAG: hypothetical protein ACLQFF_12420 [Steroidobacteraceae bacterium]|jgi:hypothetical protein